MNAWRSLIPLLALLAACGDSPTEPDGGDDLPPRWLDVALGADHTCALRSDATVFCWGRNQANQVAELGDTMLAVPRAVALDVAATAVEAGGSGSCALDPEGRLRCWGANRKFQLGLQDPDDGVIPTPVPGATFANLTLGSVHSCGVDPSGDAYCWGGGGIGYGRDMGVGHYLDAPCVDEGSYLHPFCIARPRRIDLGEPAVEVGAGIFFSCALAEAGTVYCWGWNERGQLGDGIDVSEYLSLRGRFEALPVAGGGAYRDLSVGNHVSCALDAEGFAHCWGLVYDGAAFNFGQLGQGGSWEDGGALVPEPVAGGIRFASIVANAENSIYAANVCGISVEGSLHCWGGNHRGQLGTLSPTVECWRGFPCVTTPAPVAEGTRFSKVALGMYHTCALTTDGELFCWGHNQYGQLGVGDQVQRDVPEKVELPAF